MFQFNGSLYLEYLLGVVFDFIGEYGKQFLYLKVIQSKVFKWNIVNKILFYKVKKVLIEYIEYEDS